MSDADDEYAETFDDDLRRAPEVRFDDTIFDDTLALLDPPRPVCVAASVTVQHAVNAMVAQRQAAVVVVDADGRLTGIFTERDVLRRVVAETHDPVRTAVGSVMTPNPEALGLDDRVAHALHCMAVAGYRTLPIVDGARRPIGVVTATDVIRWLGNLFPEAVLNLRPGDTIKNPDQIDAG